MSDTFAAFLLVAAWLVIQFFVLPKMGVPS
jgi:hypothetical protein